MCLREITNDEPITRGYKVFCKETESEVTSPFFGNSIQKGKWANSKSKNIYHIVDKTFSIFGKKISYNENEFFYEAGFHVFHTKEDVEDYKTLLESVHDKWYYPITRPGYKNLRSHNLVIKEVHIEDPICVGYQRYKNDKGQEFTARVTVAKRIYVL